jgi:hypothetical protein
MFFSARWIVREFFRQIDGTIEQHLKAGCRVAEMNADHTIVDLATVAVVLPTDTHGMPTAFGRAGLVHAADRFGMGMVLRDDLLAAVSELLFIPLDRLEKTLQCSRCDSKLQGNAFGRFAVQIRQLAFDIDS